MKTRTTSFTRNLLAVSAMTFAVARGTLAADPTAFELIKSGDPYVGMQSKDKVVAIHSEKSAASLTPDIWYVTYYDPDSTLKAVEVKFGAGQKMDVSHPLRLIEPVTGEDKILDTAKLKVDSDRVQEIALSQPLLKNLAPKAMQFWLQHGVTGPEWKVRIWVAKINYPGQNADIGTVNISATDGSLVKTDLHPNSAN